tara:strand:+ start:5103 stop:6134 length:1032 start_codon:yes stop_codon:yes gene_type:complete
MTTLIVPAAGKSTRFPNMRPKYVLTNWDGKLMIEKAINSVPKTQYDRLIITTLAEHGLISVLEELYPNAEILTLHQATNGPAYTVKETIERQNVSGHIIVKDTDSWIKQKGGPITTNSVAVANLQHHDVPRIAQKSFVKINNSGHIVDIVEKSVVSDLISVGCYSFRDAHLFIDHIEHMRAKPPGELFLSHIILNMILNNEIFTINTVSSYIDVGTAEEWRKEQEAHAAYFVDIDGTIIENQSQYFEPIWGDSPEFLYGNIDRLLELERKGATIIWTTARPEKEHHHTFDMLVGLGFKSPPYLIMDLPHTKRFLINDYSPTNPYPSATAINVRRNSNDLGNMI